MGQKLWDKNPYRALLLSLGSPFISSFLPRTISEIRATLLFIHIAWACDRVFPPGLVI